MEKITLDKFQNVKTDAVLVSPATTRWLALCALAGQILFTLAWFVLGFISPGFTIYGTHIAPYSALTTPLSGLGLGPTAPFMNTAFIVGGILTLVGVIGIFRGFPELNPRVRWTCMILFALSPLGMVLDGIFTLESFMPHMLGFLLGAVTPLIGFVVVGNNLRRIPRWRTLGTWLLVASPLTLVLLVLTLSTFSIAAIEAGRGVAGLTERILVLEISVWISTLSWVAFRHS